jgi:hypothetical protein
MLYFGHWPTMRGEEIRDFIAESRQTVELLDRVILASLEKNRPGLTLKELMDAVANVLGDWPPDQLVLAMFPGQRTSRSVGRARQNPRRARGAAGEVGIDLGIWD